MTDINNLFFELIRVAIGNQVCLSQTPKMKEWQELYAMSKKQSLVGICFAGVKRLQAQRQAPNSWGNERGEMLYLQWLGMAAKIQQRNAVMDVRTKEALSFFRDRGCACQVLKGQGMAELYGSLKRLRQSGDIDIWINGGKEKAFELSKQTFGKIEGLTNYHLHFPILKDAEIELHFKPSFLSSPRKNKRFLEFCERFEAKSDCAAFPSLSFSRVYILLHCYRHLCGHGVGMRQLLDYYYVLKQGFNELEKKMQCTGLSNLAC